jgi:hypothetical protein
MINNFEQIKGLLEFDSDDDFYHLQVLKRKKENPELGSNSHCIKTYYISSKEYLDLIKQEIVDLCNSNNARAYINLNRRSFERIAFQTLKKVTDQIMNKDYFSVRKAYDSACGSYMNEPNKKWILDFDTKDESFLPSLKEQLFKLKPEGNKIIDKIETKHGYHIITKPFQTQDFNYLFSGWHTIEKPAIQSNNPTILYIP